MDWYHGASFGSFWYINLTLLIIASRALILASSAVLPGTCALHPSHIFLCSCIIKGVSLSHHLVACLILSVVLLEIIQSLEMYPRRKLFQPIIF